MRKKFVNILRTLKYRNYRLFFIGQSISLTGMWMQTIALGWLVYRLTNSAALLGIVSFLSQLPILLLTPIAGVIADRNDCRKILIITQSLGLVQALILAVLVFTGMIMVWQIIVLSVLLGVIGAFDMPTRQSFVVQIIDKKEDMGNAIALNSALFNSTRLFGPSIAGILIAVFGEGICFLINGLSYIAPVISLIMIKNNFSKSVDSKKNIINNLREGFRYVSGFRPIKAVLLLVALGSFAGFPYVVLMPVFAKEILLGGPETLGFLMGASGVGAFIGAIYLASRNSAKGLEKIIPAAAGIFGIALVLFSFSKMLWLSMVLIAFVGLGMVTHMVSSNTLIQFMTDDNKRGRVMSFFTLSLMGTVPFGSLIAGSLAQKIGAPRTVFIGGILCIIGSYLFARNLSNLKKQIHPIHAKKEILPLDPTL